MQLLPLGCDLLSSFPYSSYCDVGKSWLIWSCCLSEILILVWIKSDWFGKEVIQCIWLCVVHHHVECLLKSSMSAHVRMLKYCSGEERMVGWLLLTVLPLGRGEVGMLSPTSAPFQQCTSRKSRVPQYCWGQADMKRVPLGRYQFYPSDRLRSRGSRILL